MRSILLAAIALTPAPQDAPFVEDDWESWNSFAVGSSVTLEIETVGREPKITRTVTLKSKAADRLVLATKEGDAEQDDETIEKPAEKPEPPDPNPKCAICGKHAGAERKQAKEKLRVGGKDYECIRIDQKAFDCKGNVTFRQVTWYSKDVPGWRVKSETEIAGMKSVVRCTGFSRK